MQIKKKYNGNIICICFTFDEQCLFSMSLLKSSYTVMFIALLLLKVPFYILSKGGEYKVILSRKMSAQARASY